MVRRVTSDAVSATLARSALLIGLLLLLNLLFRLMSFPLIWSSSVDVSQEALLELVEGEVSFGLFLLDCAHLGLLNLNLIIDVERPAIFPLQVGASQPEMNAILFVWLVEAVTNDGDNILLLDLFEVLLDFLTQSVALLLFAHHVLNLLEVVSCPVVLVLLDHLDGGSAVARPHVLNEVSAVADGLTLQSEDKGARSLVETIRAANLSKF